MPKNVVITDTPSGFKTENIPKTDGVYFNNFLGKKLKNLTPKDQKNIFDSTLEILSKCDKSNLKDDSTESNTGIVIGKIQSGKTLSFTGVISLAVDNGYRIVFILAGTKKLLENQTYERLAKVLTIDHEDELRMVLPTEQKDIEDAFRYKKTIVIPILKHQNQIVKYTEILKTQKIKNYLKKATVLIFDDEADQASLNTQERKNAKQGLNNQSTIFKTINDLRKAIPNHSFIQYTATPQANLLVSQLNILSPEWHVVLTPGSKYTGGDKFFKNEEEFVREIDPELVLPSNTYFPPETKHLKRPPKSLKKAIREFLVLASLKFKYDKLNTHLKPQDSYLRSTMMIHPTHLVNDNKKEEKGIKKFFNWTENIISSVEEEIDDNDFSSFRPFYNEIKESLKSKKLFPAFPLFDDVTKVLADEIMSSLKTHQVIGGYLEKGKPFQWKSKRNHILVGGSILDRGFTVENLIMTYMPRDTKSKNQADTIEQRCRFYGYRSDYIDFCRVYLTDNMIGDLKNYNESEKYLTNYLKDNSLEEFNRTGCRIMMDHNLVPTNLQRLSDSLFSNKFAGWSQFEPQFESDFYKENNTLIDSFEEALSEFVCGETNFKKAQKQTEKNTHMLYKTPLEKVQALLLKLKINNKTERIRCFDLLFVLNKIAKQKPNCYVLKMSYKARFRDREVSFKIKADNNSYKVNQFMTATVGQEDRKVIINQLDAPLITPVSYKDEVVFQIHTVKANVESHPYDGKRFKTIACHIPNKFKTNFIRKR